MAAEGIAAFRRTVARAGHGIFIGLTDAVPALGSTVIRAGLRAFLVATNVVAALRRTIRFAICSSLIVRADAIATLGVAICRAGTRGFVATTDIITAFCGGFTVSRAAFGIFAWRTDCIAAGFRAIICAVQNRFIVRTEIVSADGFAVVRTGVRIFIITASAITAGQNNTRAFLAEAIEAIVIQAGRFVIFRDSTAVTVVAGRLTTTEAAFTAILCDGTCLHALATEADRVIAALGLIGGRIARFARMRCEVTGLGAVAQRAIVALRVRCTAKATVVFTTIARYLVSVIAGFAIVHIPIATHRCRWGWSRFRLTGLRTTVARRRIAVVALFSFLDLAVPADRLRIIRRVAARHKSKQQQ